MNMTDLAETRLVSQGIGGTKFSSVKNVVSWMGAIQAQDYGMAKWAIGVRLQKSTDQGISTAIDKGDIIRTHILRPTWHFVSSDDIYWMLELSAKQVKASFSSRHAELGLSAVVLRKSNAVIEKALIGGRYLTREELIVELVHAKIATNQNRASHIFAWAELEGIICSGPIKNGKQTYAILEERVQKKGIIDKDEALACLAKRYFTSRCPATIQDFQWWSGLSMRDAKSGLEMINEEFSPQTINLSPYWFPNAYTYKRTDLEEAYLLPAFDEYIISYKNRSISLPTGISKKAISDNGIFRPIIVVEGQVIGTWKRNVGTTKVLVEADLFDPPNKIIKSRIKDAAGHYGEFMQKNVELNFNA